MSASLATAKRSSDPNEDVSLSSPLERVGAREGHVEEPTFVAHVFPDCGLVSAEADFVYGFLLFHFSFPPSKVCYSIHWPLME